MLLRRLSKKYLATDVDTKYNNIIAHYEATALTTDVAKELGKKLAQIESGKRQAYLEKFVVDEGISGDDLLDLMYDLSKEGFSALKKPTIQVTPKQPKNDMIAMIEAGKINKDLGDLLQDAKDGNTKEYNEVIAYFNKNQKAYGKFMELAEKNEIGFYEKSFGSVIPITKEAFEQVTNDYLLDSILYASVYSGPHKKYIQEGMIKEDALEYAFSRFKNPIKTCIGYGQEDMFPLMVERFKNKSGWKQKLKTWFKDLTPDEQKGIEENHWDSRTDGDISDYK